MKELEKLTNGDYMKLKPTKIQLSSGGSLTAILNVKDCEKSNIHRGDRIVIVDSKGNKVIARVDTTADDSFVPEEYIGLNYELSSKVNTNASLIVELSSTPESIYHIKKKLDGKELSEKELKRIIIDIVDNALSEIEITYFVAASYIHGLSLDETVYLTKAMVNTGDILRFNKKIVVDKHCIGGVAGNRTTMIVVPIIASLGLTIPKTSSRSITSPAGTADTMEILAKVDLNLNEIERIVNKTNGCIAWGGSLSLAPADDIIIKVEHPLGVDAVGQMVASVLAKKKSVSSTHVLIDIPYGKGSKINNLRDARKIKELFVSVGFKLGLKIDAVMTNGKEPIGNGIGPALEAKDVLYVLMNDDKQPLDLREKSLFLAGKIIEMATKKRNGYEIAKKTLDSGDAYKKMVEIIKAQGKKAIKPEEIEVGGYQKVITSKKEGTIKSIDNQLIVNLARITGAPKDNKSGVFLHQHSKRKVSKGDKLITIYSENKDKLDDAVEYYNKHSKDIFRFF